MNPRQIGDTRDPRLNVTRVITRDGVDLQSCPFLADHPIATRKYATVISVHRLADRVAIAYEGIDVVVDYPLDTMLLVIRDATRPLTPFQAGGNAGGDLDQEGQPVIDGMWYLAEGDMNDDAVCIAGPFQDLEEAIEVAWGPVAEVFTSDDFERAHRIASEVLDSLSWTEVDARGQWEAPFLDGYVACPTSSDPRLNHPIPEEIAFTTRCQTCGRNWPIDSDAVGCPSCGAGA